MRRRRKKVEGKRRGEIEEGRNGNDTVNRRKKKKKKEEKRERERKSEREREKLLIQKILIPKCPVYFYIYFSIYETL